MQLKVSARERESWEGGGGGVESESNPEKIGRGSRPLELSFKAFWMD